MWSCCVPLEAWGWSQKAAVPPVSSSTRLEGLEVPCSAAPQGSAVVLCEDST